MHGFTLDGHGVQLDLLVLFLDPDRREAVFGHWGRLVGQRQLPVEIDVAVVARRRGRRPNRHIFACRRVGRSISVQRGVSKRVEDGERPPTLQAGHPKNGHTAVSGVTRPQGIE
jgi:hypothetical protein